MNRHHVDRTQEKCTRILHAVAELRYPLKTNNCSAVMCKFLRRFEFCYQNISLFIDLIKEVQKKYAVHFKGTAISAITLHILSCRQSCFF